VLLRFLKSSAARLRGNPPSSVCGGAVGGLDVSQMDDSGSGGIPDDGFVVVEGGHDAGRKGGVSAMGDGIESGVADEPAFIGRGSIDEGFGGFGVRIIGKHLGGSGTDCRDAVLPDHFEGGVADPPEGYEANGLLETDAGHFPGIVEHFQLFFEEALTEFALAREVRVVDVEADRVAELDEGVSGRDDDGGILFGVDQVLQFRNRGFRVHLAERRSPSPGQRGNR